MAKKHTGQAGTLGLLCFGITTCLAMLGGLYPADTGQVAGLMAILGGYVQIIAGVIEIYREDAFHGTVFCAYGCFWVAMSQGAGSVIYFCTWGFVTIVFTLISLRSKPAVIVLFGGVAIALFLLAFGLKNPPMSRGGHWLGFWMGVLAIYCGFGPIFKETYGWVLPGMDGFCCSSVTFVQAVVV